MKLKTSLFLGASWILFATPSLAGNLQKSKLSDGSVIDSAAIWCANGDGTASVCNFGSGGGGGGTVKQGAQDATAVPWQELIYVGGSPVSASNTFPTGDVLLDATVNTGTPAIWTEQVTSDSQITYSGSISTQNLNPASGIATVGSSVAFPINGQGIAKIQISGTYTGVLSLQATVDGVNWVTNGSIQAVRSLSGGSLSATILTGSTGIFEIEVSGYTQVRVSALAAVTGTAVVTAKLGSNEHGVYIDTQVTSTLSAGAQQIGTVSLTPAVTPSTTTGLAWVSAVGAGAVTGKATAGNLYGATVSMGTTAGFLIAYNATAIPTAGAALTASLLADCVPAAASVGTSINYNNLPEFFSAGVQVFVSTNCGTYTAVSPLPTFLKANYK
jgi:hypothetical protein